MDNWYLVISLVFSIGYVANSNLLKNVFLRYKDWETYIKLILFINYATIFIFIFWMIFPVWVVHRFYSQISKFMQTKNENN
jgi:hypothetical protein